MTGPPTKYSPVALSERRGGLEEVQGRANLRQRVSSLLLVGGDIHVGAVDTEAASRLCPDGEPHLDHLSTQPFIDVRLVDLSFHSHGRSCARTSRRPARRPPVRLTAEFDRTPFHLLVVTIASSGSGARARERYA